MSSGISMYATHLDRVHAAFGSKDEALVSRLMPRVQSNEQRTALRELINLGVAASSTRGDNEWRIGVLHAFELLCEHFGRFLPNTTVSPLSFDVMRDVDSELAVRGLRAVSLSELCESGPPFGLPAAEGFPSVGTAAPSAILAAHSAVRARPLSSADARIDSVFAEIDDWLTLAAADQSWLVGFMY